MKIKVAKLVGVMTVMICGIIVIGCDIHYRYFCNSYIQEYILYDGIEVRRATYQ